MSTKPYSRDELKAAADGRWPDRGERCGRCGVLVPQFADLTVGDRGRIVHLIIEGRKMLAQRELMAATDAPPRFAKIWVLHEGCPQPRFPGPSCPYCGEPLASSRTRQCLHCHRDWHGAKEAVVPAWGGITRARMMDAVLQECPSFASQWSEFLDEWSETEDKPLYIALGALARHLIVLLAAGDAAGLSRVFEVVERWHLEGDSYVKEAASVGLLEDLQNSALHPSTSPRDFEPFLLPESLKWWRKIEKFWSNGEPITED